MQKTVAFAALAVLALAVATGPLAIVQAGDKKSDAVTPSPTAENVELPKADADGWISLFNGKDLKGWYGDPKIWRVESLGNFHGPGSWRSRPLRVTCTPGAPWMPASTGICRRQRPFTNWSKRFARCRQA